MASKRLVLFKERDSVPLRDWLDKQPVKVQAKSIVRLELLENQGEDLRRPMADYLRDGIYELRIVFAGAQYRILYFFHGRTAVVATHGFLKPGSKVPEREIALALERRGAFEANPTEHSFDWRD
jgi:phage-related protein